MSVLKHDLRNREKNGLHKLQIVTSRDRGTENKEGGKNRNEVDKKKINEMRGGKR